ncbi:serine hydrolase domain-containing protein [Hyphococcus sp.]|jgi:CubicO group peptidase (beta-lactamase class C family)|uniref:serine hydrolase domain-containing protein n=1 Tax=Hyphococcus sp. TaxID=2038636 RepID=UPI003D0DEDC1
MGDGLILKRHSLKLAFGAALLCWGLAVFHDARRPMSIPGDLDAEAASALLLREASVKAEKYGVTGAYVGVLSDGSFHGGGVGFADRKNGIAVTADTAFNIGSVSKPVAAWGVLALADDGLIDLDAPAALYLKQWTFPAGEHDASGATVRRLLQHTAGTNVHGYAGYPSLTEPEHRLFREADYPPASLAESASTDYPIRIVREPGVRRVYSGGGYSVLQMMIEDVSGRSFSDYMRDRVLRRAGMKTADFTPENIRPLSQSFNYKGDVLPEMKFHALAAAGLYASGADMRAFLEAQMGDSGGVLSPEFVQQALDPVSVNDNYAMSYTREQTGEGLLFGHGGNNSSWHAQIYFMPQTRQGFYFLTNSTTGAQFEIDLSCAWKSWRRERRAEDICREDYALTRNLSIATAVIGAAALLFFARAAHAIRNRGARLALWPRQQGAFRKLVRLVAIIFGVIMVAAASITFFSDFIYWRRGVVFRDEIPLHEMRLMIPAILALLTGALFNLLLARKSKET